MKMMMDDCKRSSSMKRSKKYQIRGEWMMHDADDGEYALNQQYLNDAKTVIFGRNFQPN